MMLRGTITASRLISVAAATFIGVGCGADINEVGTVAAPTTAIAIESAIPSTTTTVVPSTTEPATTTVPDIGLCQRDGNSMVIDATCIDRQWPLTVEQGTLFCDADAVTFVADGQTYALNGLARGRELGMDIDPIWIDNPDVEGYKISIGPLIDLGLTLCE